MIKCTDNSMSIKKHLQLCNIHTYQDVEFQLLLYAPCSQSSAPPILRYYFYNHRFVLPTLELHNNGIR